jgi:CRP-like cAMP-binding protein
MNDASQNGACLADREAASLRLAAVGRKEEALQALFDLIVERAEAKDFANAERLRKLLYDIDPLALTEIVHSGEIIEQEKTAGIERGQLQAWTNLLEFLTQEEFNTIYHGMEKRDYGAEQTIVSQGAANSELYFINQGRIKVSYLKEQREIYIKSLSRGQVAGENFFTPSFWTVSLTALTPVNIAVLPKQKLAGWEERHPGLEAKIRDYCQRFNDIDEVIRKKGLERRGSRRFPLTRKVMVQISDQAGKVAGRGFQVELVDISREGLALVVHISKRENARLLLGRNLQVTFPAGGRQPRCFDGIVLAVQPLQLLENIFSVHLKLSNRLDQETIQALRQEG